MIIETIDPRFLTVQEWTDAMTYPLIDLVAPPRLDDPDHWQHWALQVVQASSISAKDPPNPWHFEDWRDWAFRFNQAIS